MSMGTRLYSLPGGDWDEDKTKVWNQLSFNTGMRINSFYENGYRIAKFVSVPYVIIIYHRMS